MSFSRVFVDFRWFWPVVATALASHIFCALLRRYRLIEPLPLLLGLVFVAVLSVYVVLPHSLTFAMPLWRSWTTVHQQLLAGHTQIQTMATPIPATPALTLLAVWAVGAAAVIADWLAFRLQTPLQATAPGVAVFIICCALGSARARAWLVGLEVAALATFLLVHRVTIAGRSIPAFGGHGGRPPPSAAVAMGAGAAAIAVFAAVAVTPTLPKTEGTGVLGWKTLSHGSGGRVTPSPFDDLRSRLIDETPVTVMTVRSAVPSYWRLTSLDTFTGQVWQSNNRYHGVSHKLPGESAAQGAETVRESFHIEALDSIWLPTAFDPESVRADHPVTWDPQSDSLLSSKPTANGENYQVTSVEKLAKLSPEALSSVPSVQPSAMAADLRLPAEIPLAVVRLAEAITASQPTEYTKAYALEQFFHQPEFVYSLNPPSDDSTSALENFLFRTHEGYCQQFAGAYAVLARLAGLPTRIAIGFQTGTPGPNGLYQVSDSDAHAWPEVYFPTIGWVPFEPTPGRQVPGAAGYTGSTATQDVPAPPPTTPVTPTNPTLHRPGAAPPTTLPAPPTLPAVNGGAGSEGSSLMALAVAAAVALGAGAGWVAGLAAWRRRRWRRRRADAGLSPAGWRSEATQLPPERSGDAVLVAWDETTERLGRWDARRGADETFAEFASRMTRELGYLLDGSSDRHLVPVDGSPDRHLVPVDARSGTAPAPENLPGGGIGELARLAQRAVYGRGDLRVADADRAWAIAELIGHRVNDAMPPRRRLALLVLPGYSRTPAVVPAGATLIVADSFEREAPYEAVEPSEPAVPAPL